jgi:Retrotransposon gag protein
MLKIIKSKLLSLILVGEAYEWFRYFKSHTSNPSWVQFNEELLDRFNVDSKDPVDEIKRVHQTRTVDEYANRLERLKAQVLAKCYTKEEYYLLGFLSGVKEEILDDILVNELVPPK